jgi:hypothetical protein
MKLFGILGEINVPRKLEQTIINLHIYVHKTDKKTYEKLFLDDKVHLDTKYLIPISRESLTDYMDDEDYVKNFFLPISKHIVLGTLSIYDTGNGINVEPADKDGDDIDSDLNLKGISKRDLQHKLKIFEDCDYPFTIETFEKLAK